ncbi:hypothetical protein [Leadbettera azotonutricia]|uniref:Uncharacterized protein n=1 Tax=Leadbettera azotonutricia (strain ATCC BAA-888 / DSM 13862 / ZAS-9) TaxID=545695 RepID=F5YF92_LEAAZ|nr:hypothetical protein [Leadbettera azotonutricia]AEF80347.1 conserved hypothetical protein [Leadbettera azotonutricia ZAS-9]
MANSELVKVMDFILNRCDEAEIDAVAAAVVRRRRELATYGGSMHMPDPKRMAKELSSQLNIDGNIEGLKNSVREYAIRIIRQEAPELTDSQIEELTRAWIPAPGKGGGVQAQAGGVPRDVLASMIDQFVLFSTGRMEAEEDEALRKEIGPWPDKYWKSFPQVIRLLLSDFLKGEMTEKDFNTRVGLALPAR